MPSNNTPWRMLFVRTALFLVTQAFLPSVFFWLVPRQPGSKVLTGGR